MPQFERGPKFDPGRVVITRTANDSLPIDEVHAALQRHLRGDWGDLDPHDLAVNESALKDGGRLFSAYNTQSGARFYIITEWDRSVTTVLLPEDY